MAKVLGPLSADVNLGDEEQTRQLGRVDIVAEETCDTGHNDGPLGFDQAALVTAEGPTLDTQQPGCFILSESQLSAPAKQRHADVLHVGVLIHGCAQRKSCHSRYGATVVLDARRPRRRLQFTAEALAARSDSGPLLSSYETSVTRLRRGSVRYPLALPARARRKIYQDSSAQLTRVSSPTYG